MKPEIILNSFSEVLSELISRKKYETKDNVSIISGIFNSNIRSFSSEFIIEDERVSFFDYSIFMTYFLDFCKKHTKKEKDDILSLNEVINKTIPIIEANIADNYNTSCNFNPLRFFKIDETLHSRMLSFLLNPRAEHGQGNIFLIEFLVLLEIEKPEDGIWHVSAEAGRIDVLLRRLNPECIIIIENKSNWATDQQNQLYRYWFQEIFARTNQLKESFYEENRNKYRILYIPPKDYKYPDSNSYLRPNDSHWQNKNLPENLPMNVDIKSFDDFIVKWLNNCITTLPELNHRMIEYIKQYIEICNNL